MSPPKRRARVVHNPEQGLLVKWGREFLDLREDVVYAYAPGCRHLARVLHETGWLEALEKAGADLTTLRLTVHLKPEIPQ